MRSADRNAAGQYDLHQIEVKFSKDSHADLKRLQVYDNRDLVFIFVDLEGFWCATHQEIANFSVTKKSGKLKFCSLSKLEDHSRFSFSAAQKEIIRNFVFFIRATLAKIQQSKELRNILEEKAN